MRFGFIPSEGGRLFEQSLRAGVYMLRSQFNRSGSKSTTALITTALTAALPRRLVPPALQLPLGLMWSLLFYHPVRMRMRMLDCHPGGLHLGRHDRLSA
jgi:hypothetical protein